VPLDWAMAQMNLGYVLMRLREREMGDDAEQPRLCAWETWESEM
jgi:hypothetical protein